MSDTPRPALNTDRELWRETPDDYYSPSIHVTEQGGIGINVGGRVHVAPLRQWHALAESRPSADAPPPDYPAILERERTLVSDGVTQIKKAIQLRSWLTEGRGSYEWDDDRWHDEFGFAIQEILEAIKPLERVAADWSNCPKTWEEVQKARAGLAEGAAVQPPAPPCSHPAELKVRTIETNTEICEFCETRDERRDALEMEAHYKAISRAQAAEITRLRDTFANFEIVARNFGVYARHHDHCRAIKRIGVVFGDCDCGLTQLRTTAERALAGGSTPPSAWIPVSERLPDKAKDVLIQFVQDSGMIDSEMCVGWLDGSNEWFCEPTGWAAPIRIFKVTHWQPLPAPPSPPPTEPAA